MPTLNLSELNIVLAVFGAFTLVYGIISSKVKNKWFLGEALPAMLLGIILGPIAAKFIDADRWGSAEAGQTSEITLGMTRVVIGVQLVIAGFQLPAKYQKLRWKEMLILLVPTMTIMWLCTALCIIATIPGLTLLAALVIASSVACTDPVLSQAVAKGPFADMYVARDLREIISSEAGANDGFGFPFLMLATYLIRHANGPHQPTVDPTNKLLARAGDVGRSGGGLGLAMGNWFLETWLYTVVMGAVIGALLGFVSWKALKFALKKKWVDGESYVLYPTALGLWIVGVCGLLGTNDFLSCFMAGTVMNWDGEYLRECQDRHDEVNSVVDVILNFGGFMYIGSIIPWSEFHQPDTTGITIGRLFALGFLVLIFRRIPAVLMMYKFMPKVVKNWKEAVFMGYFGPIGIGAVFYVEHTRHLFPKLGEGDIEETTIIRLLIPTIYWLVLFSIIVHGLSIPALNAIYKYYGVKPIQDDAMEISRKSIRVPTPTNAEVGDEDYFIAYNRFSRPMFSNAELPVFGLNGRSITIDDRISKKRMSMSEKTTQNSEYRPQTAQ
ncbi:putative Na(+)/H(+) antiporter [Podospora australis]|uniref:Na(+)/H(+) antiporter n=1 Tax=Podospora australis TaxID=1536484 RepID=A0AAN7AE32_9PEZI|nr:putative Na(+)/H(+) antiporter [Podospora australis]